jgi:hypothetical protein
MTMTFASRNSSIGARGIISSEPPATTLTSASTDETEFTERFILSNNNVKENEQPQLEPTGTMDTEYSLEAKPTRATLAETFSSGENTQEEGHNDSFQYENENTNHAVRTNHYHHHHQVEGRVTQSFSPSAHQHGEFLDLAAEAQHSGNRPSLSGGRLQGRDGVARTGMYGSTNYSTDEEGECPTSYSSGEEFINLAHEAKMTKRVDIPNGNHNIPAARAVGGASGGVTMQYSNDSYYYEDQDGTMHLEFVDSEEEQAFSFGTRSREEEYVDDNQDVYAGHNSSGMALHDRASLLGLDHREGSFEGTSVGYQTAADCSKTLNTNLETLHTDLEGVNYIPTMNEHDMMVHDPAYHGHKGYGAEEGESYADEGSYDRLEEGVSYLYEDDGTRFTGHDRKDDGTYTEHSHGENETYTEHNHDEDTYQDTVTEFTKETRTTYDDENTRAMSQLMDSYLSDRSTESWEEGSFASASRAISRIDSVIDDDGSASEGSFGDSEFYSDDDDEEGSTLFGLLKKKLKDLNVRSSNADDDDDGYGETGRNLSGGKSRRMSNQTAEKKRFSIGKKSRRKSNKDVESLFGRIGEIGMEFLSETIDQAQNSSKSPRRSRRDRDQTTKIVSSLRDIFSCGAPSRY